MQRIYYRLLKRPGVTLIPVAVLSLLLPAIIQSTIKRYEGSMELALQEATEQLHVWIPLLATWWTILLIQDFFDQDGNEIFYLYHSVGSVLREQCIVVIAYEICIVCFYWAAVIWLLPFSMSTLLALMWESCFMSFITLFLAFLFQNTGGALVVALIYCIYLNVFDTMRILSFMSVFPNFSIGDTLNTSQIIIIGVGIVFSIVGTVICTKVHRSYS